jgi:hypothetical protein
MDGELAENDGGLEAGSGDDAREVGSGNGHGAERRGEREQETWDVGCFHYHCRRSLLPVG